MDSKPSSASTNTTLTHVIYGLLAFGAFTFITLIIAGALNYYKKSEVAGTNLESHFDWQIYTFWVALAGFTIGAITKWIFVGYIFTLATICWIAYRVYMGWRALYEGKTIDQSS